MVAVQCLNRLNKNAPLYVHLYHHSCFHIRYCMISAWHTLVSIICIHILLFFIVVPVLSSVSIISLVGVIQWTYYSIFFLFCKGKEGIVYLNQEMLTNVMKVYHMNAVIVMHISSITLLVCPLRHSIQLSCV